jgi:shikimate dehydrogenase
MKMTITGLTRILAVVGDPIDGARAPEALGAVMAELRLDVAVIPIGIGSDGLAGFVRAARSWRNLDGILVTMPHKAAMCELVDHLSAQARLTGAVNLVRRSPDGELWGDQIDGEGFVNSVIERGVVLTGMNVVMLGAGGVARSIAFSLAAAGIASLTIVNRSLERALALVHDLDASFPALKTSVGNESAVAAADLLVNATSVGSAVQPGRPINPDLIRAGMIVADVVAKPTNTVLLIAAAERGATTHSGGEMQKAQFRSIVEVSTGKLGDNE